MRRLRRIGLFIVCLMIVFRLMSSTAASEQGREMSDTNQPFGVKPQIVDLNGAWRFQVDPGRVGEKEGWFTPDFDDSQWLPVSVPHTWNVMPDYSDYNGLAWYRLVFPVEDGLSGTHLRLQFDAVFYKARVWLNGVELGEHRGGYTPFTFDVTAVARVGEDNVLALEIDNRRSTDRIPASNNPLSFDWWNYGGIVRDVRLLATSPVYIERHWIVAEPDLVDSALIRVRTQIANTTDADAQVQLTLSIYDETTGTPVWSADDDPGWTAAVMIDAQGSTEVELTTTLPDPKLWHFDHPALYTLAAELRDSTGVVLHQTETNFGIRKIEIRDARFYLNGEWVRLVGLTRHADSPEFGLAETTAIMAADYDDLKRLNMVFSRPVHYPQHDFILDYCDRNGILLIPEVPAWQLTGTQMASDGMRALERQQIREMIEHDFNHPSVWAWSLGNEIESESDAGHQFVQEMVGYIKSLDPTRYVGFASNRLGSRPGQDATRYADFVMMNQYFGTWVGPKQGLGPALDAIHRTWPDKLVIISEFGFEPRWNRLWGPPTNTLNREQYYYLTDDELSDPTAVDREREALIREQLDILRERPFVGGAIFWTYQDYRTPSGFKMGVVNQDREPTGVYDLLREEFAPAFFERIDHSTATVAPGQLVTTAVTVRSRGPVEQEMPAYTLQGYIVRWQVLAGESILQSGELPLPTLAPGDTWQGSVDWTVPQDPSFSLHLSIVRPTGFVSFEKIFTAGGSVLTPL